MLDQIKGLHHVTSMADDARSNNHFFTNTLGLRRVKKTVNFDSPDVYHLYYGDTVGTPGSVMTYFPFPQMPRGRAGTGEVGTTVFSVPKGSLGFWQDRLARLDVTGLKAEETFGEKRLNFAGPDGDGFAFVEVEGDPRTPWTEGEFPRIMRSAASTRFPCGCVTKALPRNCSSSWAMRNSTASMASHG